MVIRYQPLQHHISLTLPRYVTIRQGLHFIEEKRAWLVQQITENIKTIPLADGQTIPILGDEYKLCHTGGRGIVTVEEGRIIIPGDATFMKRRFLEWLKRQLRKEIEELAHTKVQLLGKTVNKISLRDTSSRWGSCSHDGNLSFSWRLVFAPYEVLEYVVCHEVAHIKHHNHSPAFWAAVGLLCPDYEKSRHWLKTHGAILYSYN
jgi:predicted metal-dependent hydrolase